MRKIVRVLGKRGRITIPYEIRIRNNIGYNDILSFEEKDANTIILRKEKLCGGCTPECFDEMDDFSIEDFLDSLTPEQQRKATIHLNLLWAQREGAKSMAEHKAVYRWSQDYAKRYDELDQWRESYKENCTCARAIEKAINDNYHDNRLNTDSAQGIIAEYGWDRVRWVLANTIQQHSEDGRFSPDNKKWAESFYMPEDDNLWHFSVEAHPGLVNMFVDRVQKEWQALGLFDRTHCTDEGNYEDKLIVLKPSSLKDQYKTPEFQLFYATSGFGCDPKKIGTQVAGHFLKDGEYAHFRRADFIGVVREDCIPEWAQEKLKQYQEPVEQTDIKME